MFKKSACFPPPRMRSIRQKVLGWGDFFKSPRGLCALVGSTQPLHAPRNRKHRAPRDAEHPVKSFAGLGAFSKAPKVFWYLVFCLSPDNIRGGFCSFSAAVSFCLPASSFRIVEFVVYCICIVFHKNFPARILQSKANFI